MKPSVLISGGGGDLAWSILRSLQFSGRSLRFIGLDCNPNAIGVDFFDEFYLLPPASSSEYLPTLTAICHREEAKLFYPASDAELPILAALSESLFKSTGTRTIVHPLPLIELLRDKLETNRFLLSQGLSAPATIDLISADCDAVREFISRHSWPLVLKPATSHGSRGLHFVESMGEIEFYRRKLDRPILQECVGTPESEYTCGVYVTASNEVRVISLRRKLLGGLTGMAERVESREITEYCRSVAVALQARGSINIQLRIGNRGPLLFEINPRFSSTACIRAHFGFNDASWALEEILNGSTPPYEPTDENFCYRYFQEFYSRSQQRRLPRFPF